MKAAAIRSLGNNIRSLGNKKKIKNIYKKKEVNTHKKTIKWQIIGISKKIAIFSIKSAIYIFHISTIP